MHNAAQSAFVTGRLGGAQRDVGLGRGDPPQDDRPGQQDADHEQRQPLAGGVIIIIISTLTLQVHRCSF